MTQKRKRGRRSQGDLPALHVLSTKVDERLLSIIRDRASQSGVTESTLIRSILESSLNTERAAA